MKCPKCGKLISPRFPLHDCKPKTLAEIFLAEGRAACTHDGEVTTAWDLLCPGAVRATCRECGAKTAWYIGDPEAVIARLRGLA